MKRLFAIFFLSLFLNPLSALAAGSSSAETWSFAALGGIVTANQSDLNTLITNANTRQGGISTGQFGNALEFGGYLQRRLNGSIIALQIRPSYFMASSNGSGSGGSYNYAVSGFAVMPQLRAYILEGSGIKLFIQGGVGWGTLTGKITEGSSNATFSGSNFGFQGGIGVNFCFGTRGQHCVLTEANMRYMSIDRNIASDINGTFASNSLSQTSKGTEVEINGHDLATTMSGIQGLIGYQYNL